jgi:hypothetical protein
MQADSDDNRKAAAAVAAAAAAAQRAWHLSWLVMEATLAAAANCARAHGNEAWPSSQQLAELSGLLLYSHLQDAVQLQQLLSPGANAAQLLLHVCFCATVAASADAA